MQLPVRQLFEKAYGHYGIGAFNVFNAEQVFAVFRGAMKAKLPIIIQITPAAQNYLHPNILRDCITSAGRLFPEVAYSVHLDHGTVKYCEDAIRSALFDSVMIDASHEDFPENVRITREIVEMAHAGGIAVEAELGVLCGTEDNLDVDKKYQMFTEPAMAREFVKQTKCDSLAVSVGTSHGAYKFTDNKGLQLDILAEIQMLLPDFPLVLHGASSVPSEEIERINQAGGKINRTARGTESDQLHQAIRYGVCKVNIATDMRLIWTRVHREFFKGYPDQFDMVIPGAAYMDELEKFVINKCYDLILPE